VFSNHENGFSVARSLTAVGDLAAHHDHRFRQFRILGGGHQRNRGQHRHRRLAHGNDVHVGAKVADEVLYVIDIVGQVERAVGHRHHAGVDPVGDVDVLVRQQRAHGVAQQRGVVARQRRDDQHGRLRQRSELGGGHVFLEMAELAERLVHDDFFDDADLAALDRGRVQLEGRFLVILAEAVHQLIAGGDTLRKRGVREWRHRIGEQFCRGIGPLHQRVQHGALHLVQLVKHVFSSDNCALQSIARIM
jgi:hypothetical protein